MLLSPVFAWNVPDQIDQFVGRGGRFGPRDLATLWIGYNDLANIPAGSDARRDAGVTALLANTTTALYRLVGLGARDLLVLGQQTFRATNADLAVSYNARVPGTLRAFSDRGINAHYFDVDGLLSRLRADPAAFGDIPQAAMGTCRADPACAAVGYPNPAVENPYILVDGIHLTARTNGDIAAFMANQLNAPLTIGPPGELAQAAGLAFSSTLIDVLGAERRRNLALSVPAADAADLPRRRPPRSRSSPEARSRCSPSGPMPGSTVRLSGLAPAASATPTGRISAASQPAFCIGPPPTSCSARPSFT